MLLFSILWHAQFLMNSSWVALVFYFPLAATRSDQWSPFSLDTVWFFFSRRLEEKIFENREDCRFISIVWKGWTRMSDWKNFLFSLAFRQVVLRKYLLTAIVFFWFCFVLCSIPKACTFSISRGFDSFFGKRENLVYNWEIKREGGNTSTGKVLLFNGRF